MSLCNLRMNWVACPCFFFSFFNFHVDLLQIPTRIVMAEMEKQPCWIWKGQISLHIGNKVIHLHFVSSCTPMPPKKGHHYRLPDGGIKSIPAGHTCKHTHTDTHMDEHPTDGAFPLWHTQTQSCSDSTGALWPHFN